ncbi:MAG: hypothetical protein ACI8W8_002601 [Rhodothermales bacterium]|jgi:hypothetical protein
MKYPIIIVLLALSALAQQAPPKHGDRAAKRDATNRLAHLDNPDILVLPGLLADRSNKRVDLQIESTGLGGNEACEYLLVGSDSDHAYEALLWSFAAPPDIHKALTFIGMEAGSPFDPSNLRYWAKGERIIPSLIIDTKPIPIETFLLNTDTGQTLPQQGFIFCGSGLIAHPARPILPLYNEPASICDIPRQASQGEVYESHIVNPDKPLPPHQLHTLRLVPEYQDDTRRVKELSLAISHSTFRLSDSQGAPVNSDLTLEAVLNHFFELIKAGHTPYVSVSFDAAMPLGKIKPFAAMLAKIDRDQAIHIEPPAIGQLYYKAFLPSPHWRDAAERIQQPWELHLVPKDDALTATLVYHELHWQPGQSNPNIKPHRHPIASPSAIRAPIDDQAARLTRASKRLPPSVLIIYAPAGLPYAELLQYLPPIQRTHKAIHIFVE